MENYFKEIEKEALTLHELFEASMITTRDAVKYLCRKEFLGKGDKPVIELKADLSYKFNISEGTVTKYIYDTNVNIPSRNIKENKKCE